MLEQKADREAIRIVEGVESRHMLAGRGRVGDQVASSGHQPQRPLPSSKNAAHASPFPQIVKPVEAGAEASSLPLGTCNIACGLLGILQVGAATLAASLRFSNLLRQAQKPPASLWGPATLSPTAQE